MGRRSSPFTLYKRTRKGQDIWYYSINLSSGIPQHLCEQRKSTGYSSKGEAKRYVLRRIDELRASTISSNDTIREYIASFYTEQCPHCGRLADEGRPVTEAHRNAIRRKIETYILTDSIADMRMMDVKRGDILDFRKRIIQGNELSNRTVNIIVQVLKTVFAEAVYREDLHRDPTAGIGNIRENLKSRGAFTAEELRQLFAEPWKDYRLYAAFLLSAATGMRTGEVRGATWRQIEGDVLTVDQSLRRDASVGLPKWGKVRTIPLAPFLIDVLEELKDRSIRIAENDWIFADDEGRPINYNHWRKAFVQHVDAIGVDREGRRLTPHSLRHTLNTLLIERGGNPLLVAQYLGWSQSSLPVPALTPVQGGYTHISQDSLRDLLPIIESMFQG